MNKFSKNRQDRRNRRELQRAIDAAYTPSMRAELIAIAQRQMSA